MVVACHHIWYIHTIVATLIEIRTGTTLRRSGTPPRPSASTRRTSWPREPLPEPQLINIFITIHFSDFQFSLSIFVFQYILYTTRWFNSNYNFRQFTVAIQLPQADAILSPRAYLRKAWGSTRNCIPEAIGDGWFYHVHYTRSTLSYVYVVVRCVCTY